MRQSARFSLTAAVIGLTALGGCAGIAPPNEQMIQSQAAVSKAEGAQAYQYAPVEFNTAQEKLNKAKAAMQDENYLTAKRFAEQAEVDANLAYTKARSEQAQKAAKELMQSIETLQRELGS